MERATTRITLDVQKIDSGVQIRAKRGDSARRLVVSLTNRGRPYIPGEGVTAVFYERKSDGNPCFNAAEIDGCTVTYDFTGQTTNVVGLAACEIRLYDAQNHLLTSPRFELLVDDTEYQEGDVPDSSPEYTALAEMVSKGTELIRDLTDVQAGLEPIRDAAVEAAERAEAARDEAEAARNEVRTSVGAAAASATSAKNYSVTAAQNADAAAGSAQLALQAERAAETAASAAAGSASSAGASAEDASNAAGVAGAARDEAEAARDEAKQAAEEAKEAAASGGGGGDTGQSVELTDLAGYKLSPGGLVLSAADVATQFVSEPVAVTAGELLMVTASAKYGNSLYALYDSSGAMVANRIAPATEAGEAVEELALTVPAGAVSMRLSWDKGVSETRYALVRRASAYAGPLAGVKCAVIGDSVIEAAGAPNAGLVDLMALATGAQIVNLGVGGTGWMQGQDDGTAYYQRAADIPADVRRVLLYGSGNDRELPLGDPEDAGTDTVCGCVNAALDAVYAHVPTAWVGVISPAPWQYFPPHDSGNAMELLAQALGAVCRRRGVPYLDLYHSSGLRPWDESFRELAYLNADGVHPNAAGYALIAPQCTAFLTGGGGGSGADGATPVKGVDYFTEDEVQEIAGIAAEMVEVPSGGGTEATKWSEEKIFTLEEDAAIVNIDLGGEYDEVIFVAVYYKAPSATVSAPAYFGVALEDGGTVDVRTGNAESGNGQKWDFYRLHCCKQGNGRMLTSTNQSSVTPNSVYYSNGAYPYTNYRTVYSGSSAKITSIIIRTWTEGALFGAGTKVFYIMR